MQIKNIFTKNLFRSINGVVKVDEERDIVVWQELDEYVITRELDKHFRLFFSNYLAARDNRNDAGVSGSTGVWVSGFFGSGKSHFIKMLSYLLQDREMRDPRGDAGNETQKASDFFSSKISDALFRADVLRAVEGSTDVVLFNIDSKAAKREDRDAILHVFLRVFNEMQGFSPDAPHIAELERGLRKRNLFDKFQAAFKLASSGGDWLDERDAYLLRGEEIKTALAQVGYREANADKWLERGEDEYKISIEKFAQSVKDYLDERGDNHRIVFVADEVGQFIGSDTHLMLSLQTIAENLGSVCQGRAWLIVTSQEDIDAVLGDINRAGTNDFSKIQGRFATRLSLSSSNTDEVIQSRLLEKTDDARRELERLFGDKQDILRHQLSFETSGMTLKTYSDADEFVRCYPFAPYHFQLLQKVFESIRRVGATGLHLGRGERSMLDAFQHAARNVAGRETGALVPLYEFYPAIESYLDTVVKRTIEQASDNPALQDSDGKLLRTLFLVRYIENFRADVGNLVTLSITETDADRLALKTNIEAGLLRLETQNLVGRNGDIYFFLTNEEQDVSREIKNIEIPSNEQTRKIAELLFDDVLRDAGKIRYTVNRKDYDFNRVCDGAPYKNATHDLTLEIITPLGDDYSLMNPARLIGDSTAQGGRVVVKLANDDKLGRELRESLQTAKYINTRSDAAAPETLKRILRDRAEENRARHARLVAQLERMTLDGEIYVAGQSFTPSNPQAQNALARIAEAQNYLIKNLFTKLDYITAQVSDSPIEIRQTLQSGDTAQTRLGIKLEETNAAAVREVRSYIELAAQANRRVTLDECATRFAARPYGWNEWDSVLIVARLVVAGEVTLMLDGAAIEPRAAVDAFTKTLRWRTVRLLKRRVVGADELNRSRALAQQLTGRIAPESEDKLKAEFENLLNTWRESLQGFKRLADTGNYPGKTEIDKTLALVRRLLAVPDTFEFFAQLTASGDDLRDAGEDVNEITDFYNNQIKTWEDLRAALAGTFRDNRVPLEQDETIKAALARMETIATAPRPYAMLRDTGELIATVNNRNETLIAARRADATNYADEKIDTLKTALDDIAADADTRNTCLYPLQQARRTIENQQSIPAMSMLQNQFDESFEAGMEHIEAIRNPPPAGVAAKPVKQVRLAQLAAKSYLDTDADVDELLARLKDALTHAICDGARVKIG